MAVEWRSESRNLKCNISAQEKALQRTCHATKILQTETYGKRRPRQF
jgi:hypothetical protein